MTEASISSRRSLTAEQRLPGKPGGVRLARVVLVEGDPLIDLVLVRPVVATAACTRLSGISR
jgi:hypothetical protein